MRWQAVNPIGRFFDWCFDEPGYGEQRVFNKFLWFPKTSHTGTVRWLETAFWDETYTYSDLFDYWKVEWRD